MDTKQRKSEVMSPRLNAPLAALGIAALLATPAFAQSGASATKSAPAPASQAQAQDQAQSQKQTMPDQVSVLPARSIVGRDVRDAAGTDLGKVKYLMVNAVDGRVRYAIVEPKTGADDQYVPVPWQAVKLPRDQKDPLSVDSGKFDKQKRFSKQEIADLTQPAVITSVYEVWAPLMTDQSQAGQGQGKASDEKSQSQSQSQSQAQAQAQQAMSAKDNKTSQTKAGQQQAASGGAEAAPDFLVDSDVVTTIMPPAFATSDEIRGSEVYSDDNKEYGKIDNLIIDTKRGQLAYVQVAHGGFLGLGEQVTPVPYEAMAYDHDRNAYVVGKTASELNDMQGFSADKNVNSVKLADLRTLYSNFGVKPYWQQNS